MEEKHSRLNRTHQRFSWQHRPNRRAFEPSSWSQGAFSNCGPTRLTCYTSTSERLTPITIHSPPKTQKATIKTAVHITAAMLTFVGRAGKPCRCGEEALLVHGSEPPPRAPGLLARLQRRASPAPLAPPALQRTQHAGQPSINPIAGSTHHTPAFPNANFSPENWMIWSEIIQFGRFPQSPNPRFTHLLPESYSRPKPPQSAPRYHFCCPKPLHTTTPMRVTHKGIIHLRTLCSKETSGGSTYIKHTAGSAGLSQPVSRADGPMQTAAGGVSGQTRPIGGLQSASVSSRRSTPWQPQTTHTPVYIYL